MSAHSTVTPRHSSTSSPQACVLLQRSECSPPTEIYNMSVEQQKDYLKHSFFPKTPDHDGGDQHIGKFDMPWIRPEAPITRARAATLITPSAPQNPQSHPPPPLSTLPLPPPPPPLLPLYFPPPPLPPPLPPSPPNPRQQVPVTSPVPLLTPAPPGIHCLKKGGCGMPMLCGWSGICTPSGEDVDSDDDLNHRADSYVVKSEDAKLAIARCELSYLLETSDPFARFRHEKRMVNSDVRNKRLRMDLVTGQKSVRVVPGRRERMTTGAASTSVARRGTGPKRMRGGAGEFGKSGQDKDNDLALVIRKNGNTGKRCGDVREGQSVREGPLKRRRVNGEEGRTPPESIEPSGLLPVEDGRGACGSSVRGRRLAGAGTGRAVRGRKKTVGIVKRNVDRKVARSPSQPM